MLAGKKHLKRRLPGQTPQCRVERRMANGCVRHLARCFAWHRPAPLVRRRVRREIGVAQFQRRARLGQGTVEAAVAIPILFLLMLLLLQPAIVLYDRVVMGNAAAEACRLLATSTDALGSMGESSEAFVRHRLAAVPQHECFHAHEDGCSWDIELSGDESSEVVTVRIANELKPLPLFDAGSTFLGLTNGRGHLVIEESVSMPAQPDWVNSSPAGTDPASWIGAWKS